MLAYLAKKLALLIPTFIGITIVCFAVIHLAPGEPTAMQAAGGLRGEAAVTRSMADLAACNSEYVMGMSWGVKC